jgi:hypothetical protein
MVSISERAAIWTAVRLKKLPEILRSRINVIRFSAFGSYAIESIRTKENWAAQQPRQPIE